MYFYCNLRSLEDSKGRKRVVNGGQEGVLENSVALARIIGEGI
jgi:hypothetical protein